VDEVEKAIRKRLAWLNDSYKGCGDFARGVQLSVSLMRYDIRVAKRRDTKSRRNKKT
jgi:hypothetical protein